MRTREKRAQKQRERYLQVNYQLSVEDYDRLFQQQGGKCAICEIPQSEVKRRFAVDHCHKTGQVRGLLCFRCNASIGKFNDEVELLQKAIDYLRSYHAPAI